MRAPVSQAIGVADMTQPPSRNELKAQAKRLRINLAARGTQMIPASALETVAHLWGVRG